MKIDEEFEYGNPTLRFRVVSTNIDGSFKALNLSDNIVEDFSNNEATMIIIARIARKWQATIRAARFDRQTEIMKFDYRTITEKDLFITKLKKEPIHFGFIPIWRLKEFIIFCKEHELITLKSEEKSKQFCDYVQKYRPQYQYYDANYNFIYICTVAQTNFRPLSFITRWLSDILGHYLFNRQQYSLTPLTHCFRTVQRTFNVGGPECVAWNYIIDRKNYIL